jgi:hypothetical protein
MKNAIIAVLVTLTTITSLAASANETQVCKTKADIALSNYISKLSNTHLIAAEGSMVLKAKESTFVGEEEVVNSLEAPVMLYFYKLGTSGLTYHVFVTISQDCSKFSVRDTGIVD